MNVKAPDKNCAVIIGVGQYKDSAAQDMSTPSEFKGPVYMGTQAATRALSDTHENAQIRAVVANQIDTVFCARTFADSGPLFPCPFGRSKNMGAAIARGAGIYSSRHVYAVIGGDTPQSLVAEAAEEIEAGAAKAVMICGGEAIANMKTAMRVGMALDWSDDVEAPLEDRGFFTPNCPPLMSRSAMQHQLYTPIEYYGLLENARRARQGLSREDYRKTISEIMGGMLQTSIGNPFSAHSDIDKDLLTLTPANPLFTDIYSKAILPKDAVNQGAAVIMTSYGRAIDMGLDPSRFVYLQAHVEGSESPVLERPDIDKSPVLEACITHAMATANVTAQDINLYDLYSCFPIVLKESAKVLGLNVYKDNLTLTGGLAFFGGPGNNYSLHGIVDMVNQIRDKSGLNYGLIHANGGFMSKHAVGIYSNKAASYPTRIIRHMAEDGPALKTIDAASGAGMLESFCVNYRQGVAVNAVIIGHLKDNGHRFYAKPKPEHITDLLNWLIGDDPFGQAVEIYTDGIKNYFMR
ncbi:MAG: hypothetical protein ABJG88_05870 [Litorimonas sp.]